jgi:site-specific recombinase XerD
MLLHVRCGTGAKDRSVPLPQRTLELLRQSWNTPRHPLWLFPAPGRSGLGMTTASAPMPRPRVQDAFRAARTARGLQTRASVHTLRHRYAPHLLEAGGNLRLLHAYVGHHSLTTTALSTHLTITADARARAALHGLMEALAQP